MKVLMVNGSPHKDGTTRRVLHEIEGALHLEGVDTEIFYMGSAPLRGCTACRLCADGSGRCKYGDEDSVNAFLQKAELADGFIFGSPVYYASMNGALSAFLDRAFFAAKGKLIFDYKPGAAITCARRGGTTATLDQMNKYFTITNMPIVPSQYWNMVHGACKEDVEQDLEGLQTMRTLGRNMAWMLKCIEAGRQAGVLAPQPEANAMRTNFVR